MSDQIHERRLPFERPPVIRGMLTLEVASEVLARAPESVPPGAFTTRMQMREQTQEFDVWHATIVAGSSSDIPAEVALANNVLCIAAGPFPAGLPIRRIFSLADSEIICSSETADDFVAAVCRAIELRKNELGIPSDVDCRAWLRERVSSVPLHPAAEAFWFAP